MIIPQLGKGTLQNYSFSSAYIFTNVRKMSFPMDSIKGELVVRWVFHQLLRHRNRLNDLHNGGKNLDRSLDLYLLILRYTLAQFYKSNWQRFGYNDDVYAWRSSNFLERQEHRKQLLVFCSSQQTRQGFELELLVHHRDYGSEIDFEREVSSKETCFYSYFYCDIWSNYLPFGTVTTDPNWKSRCSLLLWKHWK